MLRSLLLAFPLLLQAQTAARLYPIDETSRDPSFRAYVKRLQSAVESRNAGELRKLLDKEVVVGPGKDDKGWNRFAERWNPGDPNSGVWAALSDLLSLGFIREHPRLYLSPYLVWRFPRELNMAAHLVVIRDRAPLRERPSPNAPTLAFLSFDIVEQAGPAEGGEALGEWIPVRTLDGKTGYLNRRDAMSPLMPRAQFGKNGSRWAMMALEGSI